MTDTWADQYTDARRYRTWPSEEVIRFLSSLGPYESSPRALDLGCGAGGNLWALLTLGYAAYGIDPSPAARAIARDVVAERYDILPPMVPVYHGEAEAIPFPDTFFDVVIEVTTLQHILGAKRAVAMAECARVLVMDGHLLSVHLIDGTDYAEVFPEAPPAFLPVAEVLIHEWVTAGFLIDRAFDVTRDDGVHDTHYSVIHATKL